MFMLTSYDVFWLLFNNYLYYKTQEKITKLYCRQDGRKCLFTNALNTFYLRLYGVRHMVKDYSDRERGNLLSLHGLLFMICSKSSFICIIPQTG